MPLPSVQPRRILIVDDEEEPRQIYQRFLSLRGFQAATAVSGIDALAKVLAVQPHLALIDLSMPSMGGIRLLKILRSSPATAFMPVILMTGRDMLEEVVEAAAENLRTGPVYAKVQSLFTLEQRIEDELRRGLPATGRFLRRGRLVVDMSEKTVRVGGREIEVVGRQFDILCLLLRDRGCVSREVILKAIWPMGNNPNILDVNISRLRFDFKMCPEVSVENSPAGFRLVVAPASA